MVVLVVLVVAVYVVVKVVAKPLLVPMKEHEHQLHHQGHPNQRKPIKKQKRTPVNPHLLLLKGPPPPARGFLSFFRSPGVGFGRNLVEIHRSAPPQLSNRLLEANFDEKSQKIGGENPPSLPENPL